MDQEIPENLSELSFITRERSDNVLAEEIADKFFGEFKEKFLKDLRENGELIEKLERQKAGLIKEKEALKKQ